MNNLPNEFKSYLLGLPTSQKTAENYVSDVVHFLRWVSPGKEAGQFNIQKYWSATSISSYRDAQLSSNIPVKTINRRLSSLRHFGRFLVEKDLVSNNPLQYISNLAASTRENFNTTLSQFETYLKGEGVSEKTIQNYLSDIQGFAKFVGKKTSEGIL